MTHKLSLAGIFMVFSLTACTSIKPSETYYQALDQSKNNIGFDETQIEDDRWRVQFTGGPDARRGDVDRLALKRAAELSFDNGYNWFQVINRDYEETGENDSPVDVGGTLGVGWDSYYGRSTHVGLYIEVDPDNERRTSVTMEFIAGNGPMPDNSYDVETLLNPPVF